MKKENFKLDDEMIARIAAFAEANKLTKSSAIRLLLARALGDELENAYIAEVVLRVQTLVRGNVGKLLSRWEKELVEMLSRTLETTSEEISAQMPPEVTDTEKLAVRARSPQARQPAAPTHPQSRPVPVVEGEGEIGPPVTFVDPNAPAEPEPAAAPVDDTAELFAEAEALFWENYRTLLSELGPDQSPEEAADEAADLSDQYSQAAIDAGWQVPSWGNQEDFLARKAKAFPAGGVRGRR